MELDARSGDRLDSLIRSDRAGIDSRYIAAVSDPDYETAFWKRLAAPDTAQHSYTAKEAEATQRAAKAMEERAMAEGTGSTGGFGVPYTLDPTIVLTGTGVANPLRELATVTPITTKTWKGVSTDSVVAHFTDEAVEVSDDSPTLVQPSIDAEKAQAFIPFSIEVGADWTTLQTELGNAFADAKNNLEADRFTFGTAGTEPEGILTGGTVQVTTAGTATYGVADVYSLQEAVAPRYQPGATWLASNAIRNKTRRFWLRARPPSRPCSMTLRRRSWASHTGALDTRLHDDIELTDRGLRRHRPRLSDRRPSRAERGARASSLWLESKANRSARALLLLARGGWRRKRAGLPCPQGPLAKSFAETERESARNRQVDPGRVLDSLPPGPGTSLPPGYSRRLGAASSPPPHHLRTHTKRNSSHGGDQEGCPGVLRGSAAFRPAAALERHGVLSERFRVSPSGGSAMKRSALVLAIVLAASAGQPAFRSPPAQAAKHPGKCRAKCRVKKARHYIAGHSYTYYSIDLGTGFGAALNFCRDGTLAYQGESGARLSYHWRDSYDGTWGVTSRRPEIRAGRLHHEGFSIRIRLRARRYPDVSAALTAATGGHVPVRDCHRRADRLPGQPSAQPRPTRLLSCGCPRVGFSGPLN